MWPALQGAACLAACPVIRALQTCPRAPSLRPFPPRMIIIIILFNSIIFYDILLFSILFYSSLVSSSLVSSSLV